MSGLNRREFLQAASAGAVIVFSHSHSWSQTAPARIEVLIDEPIGTISPNLHGHFAENLGGVIYDGIWVGEDSKIPNMGGMRTALVERMRQIKAPVVRWPGGCFADTYDWKDGIGPRKGRPRRTNFWVDDPDAKKLPANAPQKADPNTFGTSEFARFCRLIGAQPYIAANLRGLPALDFYRWLEYCNAPAGSTTLAEARAAAGDKDPYNVLFWGVGNEAWGCGGNFLPEEYAEEFRRFIAAVPRYGQELALVASGPNEMDLNWTRGFFEKLAQKRELRNVYGWALHHYSWNVSEGRTNNWFEGKGDAIQFSDSQWYELLKQADETEPMIHAHWSLMGEFDREHQVKLLVDEWGAWHRPGSQLDPSHLLGQNPTLRDAVLSGLSLDIFHRNAEKLAMCNVAQLINCLNCLFESHEDHFIVTPVFHVFEMYAAHQGGQAVRALFSAPQVHYTRQGSAAQFWGLNGSASLHDKDLVLTVVNPSIQDPRETEIVVPGAAIQSCNLRTLTNKDIHAHNSFESPNVVQPTDSTVQPSAGKLVVTFPAASVNRLQLKLA